MQLRVDDAFDRMLAYFCPIRRHFTGTVMRTNVLPIHWMFLQFFMRLFSEAKAIHVKGQEEAFLTTAALEESLQPYLRPKIFSLEVRLIVGLVRCSLPIAVGLARCLLCARLWLTFVASVDLERRWCCCAVCRLVPRSDAQGSIRPSRAGNFGCSRGHP